MNSNNARKSYGTLVLTPAVTQAVQLEWALVEQPVPAQKYLNFPFVDQAPTEQTLLRRNENRPLAA